MWDASAAAGLAAGSGALHGFAMGTPSGSSWRTEKVASRFLSLLQSASLQTFSAISGTTKKPNCRRHSHDRLVGSIAERYGTSLSEGQFVSEAWDLADLLYKLFCHWRLSLVRQSESRYPFRLPPPSKGLPNRLPQPQHRPGRNQRWLLPHVARP